MIELQQRLCANCLLAWRIRQQVCGLAEMTIDLIDMTDGDPDFEPDTDTEPQGDSEPALGYMAGESGELVFGSDDDGENDPSE